MRRLLLSGILALLAALAPAPLRAQGVPVLARPVPPADSAAAAEVLLRTREWHDAIIRADTTALRELLAPEFTLTIAPQVEAGQVRLDRYLANVATYNLHEDRWEASDVRVVGDVAVVTSRFWQRATPGGRDRSGRFVLTDVWDRRGGTWRVVARWSTWLDAPE